jgi:hypothetical protein
MIRREVKRLAGKEPFLEEKDQEFWLILFSRAQRSFNSLAHQFYYC